MICDEIVNISQAVLVNIIDKTDSRFIGTILLVIMSLLLLGIIVVDRFYYLKP